MKRNSFLQLPILLFFLFCLSNMVFGQGGSGDLPPVPKSTNKAKGKVSTKTKSTTKPVTKPATISAKEPGKIEPINFDNLVEGKIDAATAGRMPPATYYQEYTLTATDADLFTIELRSANPNVRLELEDKNKNALTLKRDEASGIYRLGTDDTTLPESGDYRIKILTALAAAPTSPIQYSLKLTHLGLTAEGYQTRLQQIINAFNMPGERKVDEAIGQLERLVKDDPAKAGAYEYLGMIYNEYKQDIAKASSAMLQAIKLGGVATFKITHDSRWRKPILDKKLKKMVWQEQRTNWLKISAKQLLIAEFTAQDKTVVALNANQIMGAERVAQSSFAGVKHNIKSLKPEILSVSFGNPSEADVAIDLIKGNLLQKGK